MSLSELVRKNIRKWCACVRQGELVTPYTLQRFPVVASLLNVKPDLKIEPFHSGECSPVMYLLAVFLLLFTAWVFLGWMYGESRDVRWLRNWCAGIFVLMATLICLGGGAVFARRATQASCRASLEQFAKLLEERVEEGRIQDVRDAISHLANRPDEWSSHSPDILTRINEVTQALEKTSLNKVATKTDKEKTAL